MLSNPGSDGELVEGDDALGLEDSSDEEVDQEEFGFYDGDNKFVVRLYDAAHKAPNRSIRLHGAYNIYSPYSFSVGPNQSRVVRLEMALIVPDKCYAELRSREPLVRCTGVYVAPAVFGTGVHEDVTVRVLNSGHFPRQVRAGDAIALLTTGRCHIPHVEFEYVESDSDYQTANEN